MSAITLVFLKPDCFENNIVGKVVNEFEENKIQIIASKIIRLQTHEAEAFYAVHKERPFFRDLVSYVTRGPIMPIVLKCNSVEQVRALMGATNPPDAKEGTIRKKYGSSMDNNVLHGSDSIDAAVEEISFFFSRKEIVNLV
jgi:nucleoside-diphosphate kinase